MVGRDGARALPTWDRGGKSLMAQRLASYGPLCGQPLVASNLAPGEANARK